ncbi:putative phage protein [Escherichia phage HF4s]|nr:putative phage protein [Escherichia phage HF4s]
MQRLDLQLQETANSNKVAIIKIILNTTIQFPSKLAK